MNTRNLLLITTLGLSILLLGAFTADDSAETPTEAPATASVEKVFDVDTVHSTAIFRVQHLGAGQFYGRFNDVTGTIDYTPGSKSGLELDISIAIDSVDTANDNLDGHLKSPDFFNALDFPVMTFKSAKAELIKPEVYRVTGELTMHGQSQTITVEMERTGLAEGRRGERVGFETVFTIQRTDHGMDYGVDTGSLGNDVRVIIALEAIAK